MQNECSFMSCQWNDLASVTASARNIQHRLERVRIMAVVFASSLGSKHLHFLPNLLATAPSSTNCLCTPWHTAANGGVSGGLAFTTTTQLLSPYSNHHCSLVSWEWIPAAAHAKWMYAEIQMSSAAGWEPSCTNEHLEVQLDRAV